MIGFLSRYRVYIPIFKSKRCFYKKLWQFLFLRILQGFDRTFIGGLLFIITLFYFGNIYSMKNQGGNIKLLTKQITKAFKRYPDTFQKFGLSEDDFVAALNF